MTDERDEALAPDDESPEEAAPEEPAAEDEAAEDEPADAEPEEESAAKKIKKKRRGIDLSKVAAVAEVDRLAEINIKSTVEAILFAADDPVTPQQIAKAVGGVKPSTVKKVVLALKEDYEGRSAGFEIVEEAGGWTMLTREDFATYVRRLRKATEGRKLSPAALETLAVVAYKQPVQRAEIEDIRGVACGPMLRTLMEKDLVRTVGRAEALGRPLLYGTTKRFLKVFGLGSLKDLPKAGEVGAG